MTGREKCVAVFVACGLCVPGCGDSGEPGSPLPQLETRGGPVMAHPQIVPIVFGDTADPPQTFPVDYSRWLVTSTWLTVVGADYGVGQGSVLGAVQRPDRAPDAITDAQIVDLLFAGLADGTLPRPADGDLGSVLYMFWFSPRTVITGGSLQSCVDFGGYHDSARRNGLEVAYAVIANCGGNSNEIVASHELIEAATDPFPGNHPGYQLTDHASPWLALGQEVADLCERGDGTQLWSDGSHVAQRSWSNAAAAAGRDPCIPGAANPYFNMQSGIKSVPRIPPGGHQSIPLTSWLTDALKEFSWRLDALPGRSSAASLTLQLGTTMANGNTATALDVTVAASAMRGTVLRFYVFSSTTTAYQVLPMRAVVGDPCSSFSGCEDCTAHIGCGFCASSGRCEAQGESSCSASSFAIWPGSCPGFCAPHNGCTDCASQPGCGWCASSGQCLEASHEYSHPAEARCDYADWSFTPAYCPQ